MHFLKKNILSLSLLVLFCALSFAPEAYADGTTGTVFGTAMNKATDTFKAVKSVIFIVGGFGLVALAFFAIFGKLKWTWFASLAVGLAILAAAGAIINFAISTNGTGTSTQNLSDSLGDSLIGQ